MTAGCSLEDARSAKSRAITVFSALVQVAGVGITRGAGGFMLKVNLREAPSPGVDLPTSIDGVPVKVEVVGPLRKR